MWAYISEVVTLPVGYYLSTVLAQVGQLRLIDYYLFLLSTLILSEFPAPTPTSIPQPPPHAPYPRLPTRLPSHYTFLRPLRRRLGCLYVNVGVCVTVVGVVLPYQIPPLGGAPVGGCCRLWSSGASKYKYKYKYTS